MKVGFNGMEGLVSLLLLFRNILLDVVGGIILVCRGLIGVTLVSRCCQSV